MREHQQFAEVVSGVQVAMQAPVHNGPDISVILGTRNRGEQLRDTLRALSDVKLPPGRTVELYLVDNGSTDSTAKVCRNFSWPKVAARHLHVAEPGLARSQNAALRLARGRALLFLDDDVRPPAEWLIALAEPILTGSADAVGGGVRIPPAVKPPWTTSDHEEWLASTDHWEPDREPILIGASMAIARPVFAALGGFDEDLSHGIDSLYSYRLVAAGFTLMLRHDVITEHRLDPHRFTREGLAEQATRRAELHAFEMRHLRDWRPRFPRLRWLEAKVRLMRLRARLHGPLTNENLALPEMRLIQEIAFWPAFLRRQREPLRYGRCPSIEEVAGNGG